MDSRQIEHSLGSVQSSIRCPGSSQLKHGTVLFRPSGPHQCSADAEVEVSGYIATSDDPTHVVSSYHVRVLKLVN